MTPDAATLPVPIRTLLDAVARRRRRVDSVRAVGAGAALTLAWALAWCAADRVLHLPAWARAAALAVNVAGVAAVVWPALYRWAAGRTDYVAVSRAVEQSDPAFGGRLVTVTSRLLGPAAYRGSDAMLDAVSREAAELAAGRRGSRYAPFGAALRPWLAAMALVGLAAALARWPALDLPALLARYAVPTADVPPVTTVRLRVAPGDADVPQGEPLAVDVSADRLGDAAAMLLVSGDGGASWDRHLMEPTGPGRRSFTIARVDRDLRYRVEAGDAASPAYALRAIRRPVVTGFRVRYTYPSAVARPPVTVTNTDGVIEAPAGTTAEVSITASEPLASAEIRVGGDVIPLAHTPDPHVARATLTIDRDATYTLRLTSDRGVAADTLSGGVIRVLAAGQRGDDIAEGAERTARRATDDTAAAERVADAVPTVRERAGVAVPQGGATTAPRSDAPPAGYQERLRLYFEVLGKRPGAD